MPRKVAILVFDDAEELDVVGPLEVFGMAGRLRPGTFEVFTMAKSLRPVRFRYGLGVRPDRSMARVPHFDILVVPGGRGARVAMHDEAILALVRRAAEERELVASVCTGALVLAEAGLLKGRRATTHWAALRELGGYDGVRVERERFIRQGKVMTSGGISAGIDMALALVGSYEGTALKKAVARHMEYGPRA